jgi:hypothetical protein
VAVTAPLLVFRNSDWGIARALDVIAVWNVKQEDGGWMDVNGCNGCR